MTCHQFKLCYKVEVMKNLQNTTDYWQKRHHITDLTTVGFIGLGLSFNYWMYKVREKIVQGIIEKRFDNFHAKKILDVGSGSGFYPKLFLKLGAKDITASDFSTRALSHLRKKIKKIKFLELDITKTIPKNHLGKYDIVSAFDILYHIVDDKKYVRAIKNISQLLKTDGLFIFTENMIESKTQRDLQQVSRERKIIMKFLKAAGFKVKTVHPIFILMNTPVDSNNIFLRMNWYILENMLIRINFLGHIIGPILYPIELFLLSVLKTGPSTKIILAKKER